MTTEEKAKAYDDLLVKLQEAKVDNNVCDDRYCCVIDDIVPELKESKESEDERIRKEMIFYFTEEIPQCSIQEHSDKMREFISWLKRQEVECTKLELKAGNSYFCYKSRWERADSETFKKGLIYKCNKDGVLDNFVIKNPEQHFIEIKDERIAWLEKQKVLTTEEDLQGKEDVLWCIKQAKKHAKDENEMGTCWFAEKWLEQGGQKPNYCHHEVDLSNCSEEYRKAYYDGWNNCNQQHAQLEAEQKPTDKVEPKFKVGDWVVRNGETLQISGIDFVLDGTFHYWFTKGTWLSSKKMENAMLWTIQDAKDGDVLFIGIDSSTCIFKKLEGNLLYSYIISDGELFVEDSHYYYETSDNVHPATKEQREQLEKAMADAGYTFDFNKKELKKVEQKPVNRLKITAGNWYVCDIEVMNENMITAFHRGEVYYCPKDGYIDVNGVLCEVGTLDVFRLATKEEIPQPKSDWSEEDNRMLDKCIKAACSNYYPGISSVRDWLKSLKDRYTWKPSDEQMKLLREVQQALLGKDCHNRFVNFMYELKRLREE